MKDKTTSIRHYTNSNSLWKQLPIKQPYSPAKPQQKKGRITDFLKNIHTSEENQYQPSESQILSIMDVKYSEYSSKECQFKEKKYFTQLLLNAIKEIWGQLYEEAYKLRRVTKQSIQEIGEKFRQILQEKTDEIMSLRQEVRMLKDQNTLLVNEGVKIRQKLKKFEEINSNDLAETNRELRVYLKNMNEIMMSYHSKNIELEDSINEMKKKYQSTVRSETTSQKCQNINSLSDHSLQGVPFSQTFAKTSHIRTDLEDQSDRNQEYRQQYSAQYVTRNDMISPQSLSRKRFCRKKNIHSPTSSTVRYTSNKANEKQDKKICDNQTSVDINSLKESLRKKLKKVDTTNNLGFLRLSLS